MSPEIKRIEELLNYARTSVITKTPINAAEMYKMFNIFGDIVVFFLINIPYPQLEIFSYII